MDLRALRPPGRPQRPLPRRGCSPSCGAASRWTSASRRGVVEGIRLRVRWGFTDPGVFNTQIGSVFFVFSGQSTHIHPFESFKVSTGWTFKHPPSWLMNLLCFGDIAHEKACAGVIRSGGSGSKAAHGLRLSPQRLKLPAPRFQLATGKVCPQHQHPPHIRKVQSGEQQKRSSRCGHAHGSSPELGVAGPGARADGGLAFQARETLARLRSFLEKGQVIVCRWKPPVK